MAATMPAHRSSLVNSHGTSGGWDWSSLEDIGDARSDSFLGTGGRDEEDDESMEENIIVAAGPSTPVSRSSILPGTKVKREIFELEGSDEDVEQDSMLHQRIKREIIELEESDEEVEQGGILHDEIVVAPTPYSGGEKRRKDDSHAAPSNKKIKLESPPPDVIKPSSSYLHSVFASPTPRAALPVAQLRSASIEDKNKPSRFASISPPRRRHVAGPRAEVRKPNVPFIEIEDSDEDSEVLIVSSGPIKKETSPAPFRDQTPAQDQAWAARKEKQRLTSLTLRREAGERKMRDVNRVEEGDAKGEDDYFAGDDYAVQASEDHDARSTDSTKLGEDGPKTRVLTELSRSLGGSSMTSINPFPTLASIFRKPAKPDGDLKLRPPPHSTASPDVPAALRPSQDSTVTTPVLSLLPEADEDEQRKTRTAKAKQREENLAAQIRAQADQARKDELAIREAGEKREAEEKAEIAAQIAEEAKRKEDQAKRREEEAKKREDEWKRGLWRKRQEEADRRQKATDDLAAQKIAEERREKAWKEVHARKREDELRRKQAKARSVFAGPSTAGRIAFPPPVPAVQMKANAPAACGLASSLAIPPKQQNVDEPATTSTSWAEGLHDLPSKVTGTSDMPQHDGEAVHSCVNDEGKALRDERVRLMKERNARNKIIAAEEEPAPPEQPASAVMALSASNTNASTPRSDPATLAATAGPISLNSAEGTAAVARSDRKPHMTNSSFSFSDQHHTEKYHSKLGILTASDIKLFVWSGQGVQWSEICQMYAESNGRQYATHTVQRRARQIRESLVELDPEPGLLNRVARDEAEALRELNALVDARRPATNFQYYPAHARPKPTETAAQSTQITSTDIRLMRLKDQGVIWATVTEEAKRIGAKWHGEGKLRREYERVKELVEAAGADETLLDLVEARDQDALDRLNSAVRLLQADSPKLTHTPHRPNTAKFASKAHKVDPALGELVPHDIQLMHWRVNGMLFSEVAARLEELTGVHREQNVVQSRYTQVKAAIDGVRKAGTVDDDLLDDAMIGEQAAVERLNIAIHGVWPVPVRNGPGRPPKVSHTATKRRDSLVPGGHKATDNNSSLSSETFGEDVWTNTNELLPDSATAHDNTGRPTQGGKTISPAFYKICFDAWAEENAIQSDPEDEAEDEHRNAVTEEDMCHWVHQIQRRELSQEEVWAEEPVDIESKPWLDVGIALISPHKAMLEVNHQMFISNDRATVAAIAIGATHERGVDEDELAWAKTTTKDAGMVEVRIERRMRSHAEGVMPKANAFVLPRKFFYIMKSTTTRTPQSQDDMFGETRPPIIKTDQAPVSKTAYSTLDRANSKAIEHFTKDVQFPSNKHLNMSRRDTLVNAARENFLWGLQEKGEKAMFDQTMRAEDDIIEVRVWLEEGRLEGPRNY